LIGYVVNHLSTNGISPTKNIYICLLIPYLSITLPVVKKIFF
jgi:hypothetical protein